MKNKKYQKRIKNNKIEKIKFYYFYYFFQKYLSLGRFMILIFFKDQKGDGKTKLNEKFGY